LRFTKDDSAASAAKTLTESIAAAEALTSAEIVVVVQPRSGAYADLAWLAGAVVSALTLLALLFVEGLEFGELIVTPIVFGSGLATFAAVSLWVPPALVAARRTKRQIDDAAHAAFSRCGVHRTSGRTGILVYYSVKERAGRVLADTGVIHAVPADVRDAWKARLGAAASAADIAALVKDIGAQAGNYLPRAADDVDELSNSAEVSA
jgi:putative membrane protein